MTRTTAALRYQVCKGVVKVNRTFVTGDVVELGGIEPPTSTLPVLRSPQLSYSPTSDLDERRGAQQYVSGRIVSSETTALTTRLGTPES